MHFFRLFIGLASLLAATLSVASDADIKLSVSASPLASPVFIADSRGFFADQGLSVELMPINGGHRSMVEVLEGRADYGTSSDMVIMNTAKKGHDFRILATFVSSSEDVGIFVDGDGPISNAESLQGRRVGVTPGTASDYFLDTFLLLSGIDPQDVISVPVNPENMFAALENGDIDAASTWEPWISRAVTDRQANFRRLDGINPYTLTFNLVSSEGNADSPATRKLLKALINAEKFMQSHPEEARRIVEKRLGIDQELLINLWPHYNFGLRLEPSLILTLENEYQWSSQQSEQSGVINFLTFVESDPLADVAPRRMQMYK